MPAVIPVFERGGMEASIFHKTYFDGVNSVVVGLFDAVGDPTDGNYSNCSLVIYQP